MPSFIVNEQSLYRVVIELRRRSVVGVGVCWGGCVKEGGREDRGKREGESERI